MDGRTDPQSLVCVTKKKVKKSLFSFNRHQTNKNSQFHTWSLTVELTAQPFVQMSRVTRQFQSRILRFKKTRNRPPTDKQMDGQTLT